MWCGESQPSSRPSLKVVKLDPSIDGTGLSSVACLLVVATATHARRVLELVDLIDAQQGHQPHSHHILSPTRQPTMGTVAGGNNRSRGNGALARALCRWVGSKESGVAEADIARVTCRFYIMPFLFHSCIRFVVIRLT